MRLQPLLPLASTAVSFALLVGCGGAGGEHVPKNVLLISIDTLRPDHLGCYGHDRDTSPTLDSIAEAGVLFEDCTAAAPWTLPGHASMITGMYPSTHGVKDHVHELTTDSIGTRLAEEGFQCWALVNSHNIGDPAFGLLRDFEEDRTRYVFEMNPPEGGPIVNRGEKITDYALEWLEDRGEEPFFFFLHYYDVHTDFTPRPKYKAEFVGPYDGPMNGKTGQLISYRNKNKTLTDEDVRWLKEMYDAEIRQLDDILARLFDYLDESGLSDETLVVITSDHGEEYFEHGGVLHGRTQYQELLAIPLLMRGPGVPEGVRIQEPVHVVDVVPTIYGLLGIESNVPLDGVDLSLHWRNPTRLPETRFLYGEADHNNVVDGAEVVDIKKMIRIDQTKLLYDTSTEKQELYDLSADPGEQTDLSKVDPERAEFLLGMLQRYMDGATQGTQGAGLTDEDRKKLNALGY